MLHFAPLSFAQICSGNSAGEALSCDQFLGAGFHTVSAQMLVSSNILWIFLLVTLLEQKLFVFCQTLQQAWRGRWPRGKRGTRVCQEEQPACSFVNNRTEL